MATIEAGNGEREIPLDEASHSYATHRFRRPSGGVLPPLITLKVAMVPDAGQEYLARRHRVESHGDEAPEFITTAPSTEEVCWARSNISPAPMKTRMIWSARWASWTPATILPGRAMKLPKQREGPSPSCEPGDRPQGGRVLCPDCNSPYTTFNGADRCPDCTYRRRRESEA